MNPSGFADHAALHALLSQAFADMAGRIDPPSSMTRMSVADVAAKAAEEDLFLVRNDRRLLGCLFGTARGDVYYIGKLAVAPEARGRGLARALVARAADHARALGLGRLELQSRVELTENHRVFAALGFVEAARTAHAGYDRPTSVTFRRTLD